MNDNLILQKYPEQIIASNSKAKFALGLVASLSAIDGPVIIYGANGTGKDLFAKTIHKRSNRCDMPFIRLHGSNIGTHFSKKEVSSSLAAANGGTLLIDEIDDFDRHEQQLLYEQLQLVQTKTQIRLLTTTSSNLEKLCASGDFSAHLLDNIRGGYIELLPLKERSEDISPLVEFYVKQICQTNGLPIKEISPELLRTLNAYHWPGNVRELVNTIKQLIMTAQKKPTLFTRDLPAHIRIQTFKASAANKQGL